MLLLVAFALPATGLLKSIFFPAADSDYVYVQIEKSQGSDLAQTDLSLREVEEVLYANKHVASFASVVGAGTSLSGTTDNSGPSNGSNIANVTVNLPPGHAQSSADFVVELRKQLAGITSATITVGEPSGGPPAASPVSITFAGDDLGELSKTADNATQVLSDIPGVINIDSSSKNSSAEFVVTLDSAKAADAGISPLAVSDTLRTALFSTKATSIRVGKDDVDVRTKLDLNTAYTDPSETTYTTIDSVRALTINGTHGPVPLSSIASITYEAAQSSIQHEAGHRISTVTADVGPKYNAVDVSNEFAKRFTSDKLGTGVTMTIGGASADITQSFTELFLALIAGASLMLAILILEFNSFRQSFYPPVHHSPFTHRRVRGSYPRRPAAITYVNARRHRPRRRHHQSCHHPHGLYSPHPSRAPRHGPRRRRRRSGINPFASYFAHDDRDNHRYDPAHAHFRILGPARLRDHVRPRLLAHADPLASYQSSTIAGRAAQYVRRMRASSTLTAFFRIHMRKSPTIGIVFAIVLVDMLGVGILIPIIPLLLTDPTYPYYLGLSRSSGYIVLGFLTAIFPFMQFIATPILGQLSDRIGRKPVLAFSIAGTSLSYIVFAIGIITKDIPLLFASRALDGLTGGNIAVAQAAIADSTPPEKRSRSFGIIGAAFGIGFIIGPFLGGVLSDPKILPWFSATTPFWFAAILAFLNMLLIVFVFGETLKKKVHGTFHILQSLINIQKAALNKKLRTLFISSFLFQGGFSFFTTFFGVFLIARFHYGQSGIGDYFALIGVCVAITQAVVTGFVGKRLRPYTIVFVSLLGVSATIFGLYLVHSVTELIIVTIPNAMFIGLIMANLTGLVSRSAGDHEQGEVLGISNSVQALAQSIPPVIGGFVAASIMPSAPILVAACLTLVAAITFGATVKRTAGTASAH